MFDPTLILQEITVNIFLLFPFVDEDKNTPLFFAAEGGHLPCVALLMVSYFGVNLSLVI